MFLERGADRLFAFLHRPDGPTSRGVVLCAPLAEEKLWSHRVFVSFARELAARGYAVLRFDFRGEGDSDRPFEDTDLTTRIEDTAFAIDSLKALVPGITDVTLVGLRLGATIAAVTAAQRTDVQRLVLWDPVTIGDDYMQAVLRTNLMYQMALHGKVIENREALAQRLASGETVNIEGYELGQALFHEASALRLEETTQRLALPTLIVSVPQREGPPRDDLAALATACPNVRLTTAVEDPFWREIRPFYRRAANLHKVTADWLEVAP